jgi:GR25 family glycosyltransferase involved in LPS biosynthesis
MFYISFKWRRRILNGLLLNYRIYELAYVIIGFVNIYTKGSVKKVPACDINTKRLNALVISLPFRNDRRSDLRSREVFSSYLIINAIHGLKLNLNNIPNSILSSLSKKYLSKGSIGCIFSHIKTWNIIVDKDWEFALVLEDDSFLASSHTVFDKLLKEVPIDFDMVLLGSSNKYLFRKKVNVNKYFLEPIFPRNGLFAYIIRKKAIGIILNNIFPIKITAGGIDTIIGKLTLEKKIKVYHTNFQVFKHNYSTPSNILNYSDSNKLLHFTELSDAGAS